MRKTDAGFREPRERGFWFELRLCLAEEVAFFSLNLFPLCREKVRFAKALASYADANLAALSDQHGAEAAGSDKPKE